MLGMCILDVWHGSEYASGFSILDCFYCFQYVFKKKKQRNEKQKTNK